MRNNKLKVLGLLAAVVVVLVCVLVILRLNDKNANATIQNAQSSNTEVTILSPSGAPALSLVGIIANDDLAIDYEIVSGSDVLNAEFLKGDKDLILAPVNLGVKLIDNGAEYQLLGVVSWGNLYVVGDNSYDGRIAAFGQSAVPGKVLELVKEKMNEKVDIEYYSAVSDVAPLLLQGEYHAALLAEPVMSKVMDSKETKIIYDLQSLYKEVTGYDTYPQAAIFVSNEALSTKLEAIIEIINKIDSSIASFNEDPIDLQLLSDEVDFKGLGFDDVVLLSEAYERMALDFVSGNECVDEVRHFLELFDIEYRDTMYVK